MFLSRTEFDYSISINEFTDEYFVAEDSTEPRRRLTTTILRTFNVEGRFKRDRLISCSALQNLSMYTLCIVFGSGCVRSVMTLKGFDYYSFNFIIENSATSIIQTHRTLQMGLLDFFLSDT